MQVKGKVIKGWVGVSSTLTMEFEEGLVGPQNSSKAEKVALVFMRREIGLLSMMAITLGSCDVMVVGPGSPGLRQSSATVASPRKSVALLFVFRTSSWWRHILGQARTQCPPRPH
jgi:hypothetical protein